MKNSKLNLDVREVSVIEIENKNRDFFSRVWVVLTNPFLYIFTGKIRY